MYIYIYVCVCVCVCVCVYLYIKEPLNQETQQLNENVFGYHKHRFVSDDYPGIQ
jgi:hypothetical protein